MSKADILALLKRSDKHYLGGGSRVIWTPQFPVWLDWPGFWDKGNFYNYDIEPCFTITLLNEQGNQIPLNFIDREWNPARLKQNYSSNFGLSVVEEKAVLPEDSLVSVFTIKNELDKPFIIHYICWTIQKSDPSSRKEFIDNLELINDKLIFTKFLQKKKLPLFGIQCALGINEVLDSYDVNFSEFTAIHPHWHYSPFYDHFNNQGLDKKIKISGINQTGLIYMGLHKKITLLPGKSHTIWSAMTFARNDDEAKDQLNLTLNHKNPIKESEKKWADYFEQLPEFNCSDPVLTNYYWYRWYGLRLFTIQGGHEPNYPHSAVCEGISYFRVPITYSAQCHMLETRWMKNPEIAYGSLLNFIELQNADGSFTGHIYPNGIQTNGFYHANWGMAVLEVAKIHNDRQFLEHAYFGLARYAEYFDRNRDVEDSGLYDIVNQFETGQEFMSRYLAVDDQADSYNWTGNIRLKGVDVTVYIYQLKIALAIMAGKLKKTGEKKDWHTGAKKIKDAVLALMWDPEEEMFFDVNPLTMKPTNVKAAVCFYPYLTDIVDKTFVPGLKRHLLNPDEFWTNWPVPATSLDDAFFSPNAEWRGKRHNCPWNGRVWPMTNSHIAEVLAGCALRFDDQELKKAAVVFIKKFIQLMHFENSDGLKNYDRPNCFEHYHPFSGKASVYRGVDDYQHSWIVDLIIKYVVGLNNIEGDDIKLNPLDFGLDRFELNNVYIGGKRYTIKYEDKDIKLIRE